MCCNWVVRKIQKHGSGQTGSIHSILKWDLGPPRPSGENLSPIRKQGKLPTICACMCACGLLFPPLKTGGLQALFAFGSEEYRRRVGSEEASLGHISSPGAPTGLWRPKVPASSWWFPRANWKTYFQLNALTYVAANDQPSHC